MRVTMRTNTGESTEVLDSARHTLSLPHAGTGGYGGYGGFRMPLLHPKPQTLKPVPQMPLVMQARQRVCVRVCCKRVMQASQGNAHSLPPLCLAFSLPLAHAAISSWLASHGERWSQGPGAKFVVESFQQDSKNKMTVHLLHNPGATVGGPTNSGTIKVEVTHAR